MGCDAVHMVRCCFSLYKRDQSVDKPKHMVRCNAVHMVRCWSFLYKQDPSVDKPKHVPWWDATFPRNSHAGLGRPCYERNILMSMLVAISLVANNKLRNFDLDEFSVQNCPSVSTHSYSSTFFKWGPEIAQYMVRHTGYFAEMLLSTWSIWSDAALLCTNKISRLTNRSIWSDAVLLCTNKISRVTNRRMWSDAVLILWLPNEDFWSVEKSSGKAFCKHFSSLLAQIV